MQDLIIINALYVYMKLAFFPKGKNNLINVNDSLFDAILSFKKIEILNQLNFVIFRYYVHVLINLKSKVYG